MRIHILINCYWGTGISGGDRRILEMLKRWENRNEYSLIVYTTYNFSKLIEREGVRNIEIVLLDKEGIKEKNIILSYIMRTIVCIKKLKEYVQCGDVIYSTTDILPDVLPGYYIKHAMKCRIRWVMITFHIFESFIKRPGNKLVNFISCSQQIYANYLGKKRADNMLTTSPFVYEYFSKHGFDLEKVIITDNAVDVEIIENSNRECVGYDACFLARLNYSKGIFELPLIWERVVNKYPDAKLAIMGQGTDDIVIQLENLISEKKLSENINLLGYVDSEMVYSLMKKSKIFLFTSHEEGWGMALAEALVCEIPAVVYDLPIFRHLFKKGLNICKMKDVEEMANKVCFLLDNEDIRRQQGQEGKRYILENYSLDVVAEKELEILCR